MEPQLVITIVIGVISLLLSIVAFFLTRTLSNVERRIDALETRTISLEMAKAAAEVEMRQITQLAQSIGEMRSEIALKFASRDDLHALMARIDEFADALSDVKVSIAGIDRRAG